MKREDTKTKVVEEWAVVDTDRLYIVHDTKENAERHCEKLKGDWSDPKVVPHTTIVGERGIPESEVAEILRHVAVAVSGTANPAWLTNIAAKYKITL